MHDAYILYMLVSVIAIVHQAGVELMLIKLFPQNLCCLPHPLHLLRSPSVNKTRPLNFDGCLWKLLKHIRHRNGVTLCLQCKQLWQNDLAFKINDCIFMNEAWPVWATLTCVEMTRDENSSKNERSLVWSNTSEKDSRISASLFLNENEEIDIFHLIAHLSYLHPQKSVDCDNVTGIFSHCTLSFRLVYCAFCILLIFNIIL